MTCFYNDTYDFFLLLPFSNEQRDFECFLETYVGIVCVLIIVYYLFSKNRRTNPFNHNMISTVSIH